MQQWETIGLCGRQGHGNIMNGLQWTGEREDQGKNEVLGLRVTGSSRYLG